MQAAGTCAVRVCNTRLGLLVLGGGWAHSQFLLLAPRSQELRVGRRSRRDGQRTTPGGPAPPASQSSIYLMCNAAATQAHLPHLHTCHTYTPAIPTAPGSAQLSAAARNNVGAASYRHRLPAQHTYRPTRRRHSSIRPARPPQPVPRQCQQVPAPAPGPRQQTGDDCSARQGPEPCRRGGVGAAARVPGSRPHWRPPGTAPGSRELPNHHDIG